MEDSWLVNIIKFRSKTIALIISEIKIYIYMYIKD
jgi:hypothetical protein